MEPKENSGEYRSKYHLRFSKVEGALATIEAELATAIRDQTKVTRELSAAVVHLTNEIGLWDRSVPIKLVMIMFGVLVGAIGSIDAIHAYIRLAER